MDNFKHFGGELWRMRWMILLPALFLLARDYGYLHDASTHTLVIYKLSLACIAACAAQIFRTQCFYYVDLKEMVDNRESLMVVAFSILFAGIYAAFILGVTLGL